MKNKPGKASDRDSTPKVRGNEDLSDLNYPPKEDIMNPASEMERVDINVDNLSRSGSTVNVNPRENETENKGNMDFPEVSGLEEEDDLGIVRGTEADVTKEDLINLGEKEKDNDMGEDEEFKDTAWRLDATGDDLDVPGSEADDENEKLGEEDEENNYYSVGGDRNESLEEDQT